MTLRLRDFGIATAYATVGVGEVDRQIEAARDAADEYKSNATRNADELSGPEIVFLLGQADVAAIYETKNFKRIFDLRYPRAGSNAAVVNWVFGVPFTGGRADGHTGMSRFRFVIHLRLRRAVYAYPGIVERIVDKLNELLGTNSADARLHVGLGWSDLIVEGYFTPESFPELINFIIRIHSLRLLCGPMVDGKRTESIPVLQRILTVFGYVEPPKGTKADPPLFPGHRHLTFLRGKPGGYGDLIKLFGDEQIDILDGKADFMVTSEDAPADWLARQRKLGDGTHKKYIRKVETHLMFFPAGKFADCTSGADIEIDVGDEVLHHENCGCHTDGDALVAAIGTTMSATRVDEEGKTRLVLPTEQRYAIDNALFLLGATLRDSSICCDMRDAVRACYGGLLKILRQFETTAGATDPELYRSTWQRLDEWHRLSELLLRQRTVGSFEEILGQSDRSIVYSGGVQKFLYLADQVMMDFARRVQPINPPNFATIYDSVKTIFSFFRSGPLVRMPTSQIFSFPMIVPDLWHEVAGALFFLRFGDSFPALTRGQKNPTDFLANVADHYADVVVYLHGFRGDFSKFLTSLVYGWRLAYRDVPATLKHLSVGHFLLRAYLVYEFDQLRAARSARDEARIARFADPGIIASLLDELRVLLAERVPYTDADWEKLGRNLRREVFSLIHRQLYQPFLTAEIEPVTLDLEPFKRGEIVELGADADINALFGELAHYLAEKWPEPDFRAAAAFGESAAIEYHRRQMARKQPDGDGDVRARQSD